MKIEPELTNQDGYKFRIDNSIDLEFAGSAISVLGINLPTPANINEYYKIINDHFDIEKMINDLLNRNHEINKIIIDSEVCRVDGEIIFQTNELKRYLK